MSIQANPNKVEKNVLSKTRKDSLINFIAFLISGSLLVYWSLPTYMIHFSSSSTTGNIKKLEKFYLEVSYFNSYDNREYVLSKDIQPKEFEALRGKQRVSLVYPKFFPANVVIQEIGRKKSLLLPVTVHLLILLTLLKVGKEAFNS